MMFCCFTLLFGMIFGKFGQTSLCKARVLIKEINSEIKKVLQDFNLNFPTDADGFLQWYFKRLQLTFFSQQK